MSSVHMNAYANAIIYLLIYKYLSKSVSPYSEGNNLSSGKLLSCVQPCNKYHVLRSEVPLPSQMM